MTLFSKQVVLALTLLAGPASAASLLRGTNSTAPGACIEQYGECLGPNDDNTKNCCPGNYCDVTSPGYYGQCVPGSGGDDGTDDTPVPPTPTPPPTHSPPSSVTVKSESELRSNLKSGAYIVLGADIVLEDQLEVDSTMTGVTIDGKKKYSIDAQGMNHIVTMTGGSLLLKDTVLSNGFSQTSNGGGIYHSGGDLEIDGCTFAGNKAPNGVGGGLWSSGMCTVSMSNTTFTSNAANYAGGFYSSVTSDVEDCTFKGNAASFGGAMRVSGGKLTMASTTFEGNSATGFSNSAGGAIQVTSGTVTMSGTTFSDNKAVANGGALLVTSEWPIVTLIDYAFSGNTAPDGGDVYYTSSSVPKFYSGCVAGKYSAEAGSATLECAHYSSGAVACPVTYPARASSALCTTCPSAEPFSCCGATSEDNCAAAEPDNCAAPNAAVCP